jgi:metal transporter CNNM
LIHFYQYIYLDRLVNELEAVLISVTAVLIFGEVIPQAFCCGPHQINIAYIMSKPTKFLMYITGIFSYPIARLLDIVVGEHSHKL